MERPLLLTTISKLAVAGEQAGLSLEEMVGIPNAGVSVETLLYLIAQRIDGEKRKLEADRAFPSYRWTM